MKSKIIIPTLFFLCLSFFAFSTNIIRDTKFSDNKKEQLTKEITKDVFIQNQSSISSILNEEIEEMSELELLEFNYRDELDLNEEYESTHYKYVFLKATKRNCESGNETLYSQVISLREMNSENTSILTSRDELIAQFTDEINEIYSGSVFNIDVNNIAGIYETETEAESARIQAIEEDNSAEVSFLNLDFRD